MKKCYSVVCSGRHTPCSSFEEAKTLLKTLPPNARLVITDVPYDYRFSQFRNIVYRSLSLSQIDSGHHRVVLRSDIASYFAVQTFNLRQVDLREDVYVPFASDGDGNIFRQMQRDGVQFEQLKLLMEGVRHTYLVCDEVPYSLGLYRRMGRWHISLWDWSGGVSLAVFDSDSPNEIPTQHDIEHLLYAISLKNQGKVMCSRCGKPTSLFNSPQYYAGHYCSACWTGYIADVARQDNYE